MIRRISAAVFLILLFATSAIAQQTAAPTSTLPRFSSRSELVLVPVIVRNENKFVSGLKPEQFTLTDNGKVRPVSIFEEGVFSPAKSAAFASRPHVFGNHVSGPADRPILIILLDLLNLPFVHRERARAGIIKFLNENIDADQPTTLLVLDSNGLKEVHSFTTETRVLVAALKGVQFDATGALARTSVANAPGSADLQASTDAFTSDVNATTNRIDAIFQDKNWLAGVSPLNGLQAKAQTLDTLHAFEQIAYAYAGIPGRKALVWVSAGFRFNREEDPATAESTTDRNQIVGTTGIGRNLNSYSYFHWNDMTGDGGYYDSVWRLLIGANVAVYSLDPSGLELFDMHSTFRDTLKIFASTTGGRDCVNQNDLAICLRNAATDAQSYYVLGFYVPANESRGGWHRLGLKLNATYTDLRYRTGYFITKDQPAADEPAKRAMGVALKSPLDYTAVPMDITILEIKNAGNRRRISFQLSLPPAAFSIDNSKDRRIQLELLVAAIDLKSKQSKPAKQLSKTIEAPLTPENAVALRAVGFTYNDELEVSPGNYQLKFVVRDTLTGNIGSVTASIGAP